MRGSLQRGVVCNEKWFVMNVVGYERGRLWTCSAM